MSTNATSRGRIVGPPGRQYRVCEDWPWLPAGWSFGEAVAVATDSAHRVYVFNRGEHPVIVFSDDGQFLQAWGEGLFGRPHGIHIGPDDTLYCTDDVGHAVRRFTTDGRLLQTLGTPGQASETGAVGFDYRTIRRAAGPFNLPTNIALSPTGEIYVTDGYGNARVHKFSPDGRLVRSWGEPGREPGQFAVPHGIAIDRDGTVYVADRENSRVQLFSPDGELLGIWTDVARPSEVFIDGHEMVYVAELGWRAGLFPGDVAPAPDSPGGRVSLFDRHGTLIARWGGGDDPCAAGDFFAPHDIWVDARGSIYVSEVTLSAGGNAGLVPRTCHTLQKFVPVEQS